VGATSRPLRILGMLNHLGHQYEMLKLSGRRPVAFTYLRGERVWDHRRPLPAHLRWVEEVEPEAYDLAILHLDQRACREESASYRAFRDLADRTQGLPRLVVNHGTPMLEDHPEEAVIAGIRRLVGDDVMIVNSRAAVARWGWGQPLIHGLSPEEWTPLPKRPLVVAQVHRGMARYHGIPLLDAVTAGLAARDIPVVNIGVDVQPASWMEQRRLLGRALIFLNTTLDSPMPRGRTEAMMSGCCVLSTPYHDASDFIVSGENGFLLGKDAAAWCDLVEELLGSGFDRAVEIGARGRRTAERLFHVDRYLDDLWSVIAARAPKILTSSSAP
jgi:glycosyltransferase involved in cell wall biosynthesis